MPSRQAAKPPYSVPRMSEIAEMPWNGFKVASTFAGAGGSSTGYRMAGFRIAWANEFVPAAQESYAANKSPATFLDRRDIHEVAAADILAAAGLDVGELDIFDGSPPCQAFSTAGARHKGWGEDRKYEHGTSQKNETLFSEYLRLVDGLRPKVLIAENVSGLVKGVAKGFFLEILADMKALGYKVEARLLDAQWLGVPQARQRIIFIGVREDLGFDPAFPAPLSYRYSVRDAIPGLDIDGIESANGWNNHATVGVDSPAFTIQAGRPVRMVVGNDAFKPRFGSTDQPSPTITASGARTSGLVEAASQSQKTERRKFTISELRRICSFPDDFILIGSYAQQWERLGNSVPPLMMRSIAEVVRDKVLLPAAKKAKAAA